MKDNNLYSRWLNNELTEEELKQLKASGELDILEKIISETDSWKLPDVNENSLGKIKETIRSGRTQQKTKVIPLYRNPFVIGIAASLLLVLGFAYWILFNPFIVKYQCNAGQVLKLNLPDHTTVILNGQSSIAYNEINWEENRTIKLEGEAYFSVIKKGPFKVTFEQGEVNVLGTRFDILSGKEMASVKCYEGKVQVTSKNNKDILLTAGLGTRIYNTQTPSENFDFNSEAPEWINGESVFKQSPLMEIITALEIQYNVQFETNSIDLNRNYTGKFIHSDLDTALKMVFSPMGISYSIEGTKNKKVILK